MHHPSLIIAAHAHHTSSHDTSSPLLTSPWGHTGSRGQSQCIERAKRHLQAGIYGFGLRLSYSFDSRELLNINWGYYLIYAAIHLGVEVLHILLTGCSMATLLQELYFCSSFSCKKWPGTQSFESHEFCLTICLFSSTLQRFLKKKSAAAAVILRQERYNRLLSWLPL